ncbi:MAG: hypothetical protein HY663_05420 [Chloroflexi bacterium]|nr:hypothetical protein [Chloroflexota bacterium]
MTSSGYREEVFNVLLALLLHERGVITAPEQSFRQALQERRHVPDVLVVYRGLRTVIEGKVADKSGAGDKALVQARDRVSSGVAHIGIALLYPAAIRKTPSFPELQDVLISCTFKVAVCSETGETGWTEGGIDYLADVLRGTFDQLIREDAVTKAVDALNAGIDQFSRTVFTSSATIHRAAEILGIRELPKRNRKKSDDEEE